MRKVEQNELSNLREHNYLSEAARQLLSERGYNDETMTGINTQFKNIAGFYWNVSRSSPGLVKRNLEQWPTNTPYSTLAGKIRCPDDFLQEIETKLSLNLESSKPSAATNVMNSLTKKIKEASEETVRDARKAIRQLKLAPHEKVSSLKASELKKIITQSSHQILTTLIGKHSGN